MQSWVVVGDLEKEKEGTSLDGRIEHSCAIIVSFYRVDHTPGSRNPVLHTEQRMRNACSLAVPLKVAARRSIIFRGRDRFACARNLLVR